MKYDKHAISNTANRLKNKSSGFNSIQNRLSNVSPNKCNSNFYSKRYSLVKRIRNVQTEINSLSTDINSAASKMSNDDVQNARYIRQVFNNRASLLSFGNRGFGPGQTGLARTGIFGGSMMFSSMALNRRKVSSLGGSTTMADIWSNLANKFKSGASFLGNKASEYGHQAYNATTNFFSNAGKWANDRWNDVVNFGNSAKDYVWRSTVKLVLGDYDENHNVTILSFGANIIAGIFDVDLPLDARDLVYDIQHWGEGDNFGIYFALDCLAVVPVIGAVKYFKYVDDFAEGAKDLGKVAEGVSEAGKTIDNISDAADNGKDLGNAVESAQEAGKASGNIADASETTKDLGKVAEEAKISPSKPVDVDAKPNGTPAKIKDNMDDETIRSLTRENEAADTLARNGYDIEQNPKIDGTTRNPDYRIEGKVFDCYAPTENKSVRGIWSTIKEKVVTKGQTNRVVLNLDDWLGDINELINQLKTYAIDGLEEVIVVKGDKVISIFP